MAGRHADREGAGGGDERALADALGELHRSLVVQVRVLRAHLALIEDELDGLRSRVESIRLEAGQLGTSAGAQPQADPEIDREHA